ncbi:MAG: hypothetical protein HRU41_40575 [Saprospiraceae bacterium]|nr:hypothetical protein [Saprospiraceae bacterium]
MNRAQSSKGSSFDLYLPYMLQVMREWEIEEQIAEARAAEEERELLLRTAFALAPSFQLQHIVRRWWIAAIDEPLERIADYSFPDKPVEGVKELHRIDAHTLLLRTDLSGTELLENLELLFLPF